MITLLPEGLPASLPTLPLYLSLSETTQPQKTDLSLNNNIILQVTVNSALDQSQLWKRHSNELLPLPD